jgi:hypothetical protein
MIRPHVSTKQLALLAEEVFGLERYNIIEENVALHEAAEQQGLAQSIQSQLVEEEVADEMLSGPTAPEEVESEV